MDKSLIYLVIGLAGLLFAAIPFGVFMGIATQFEIADVGSPYLMVILYTIVIVLGYLSSLGAFAAIQNQSCGKIKNMGQLAGNAGISTIIIVLILSLAVAIPGLKGVVVNLFPPSTDPKISAAVGYSYFLFWAALYGFATGGFMASNCGKP